MDQESSIGASPATASQPGQAFHVDMHDMQQQKPPPDKEDAKRGVPFYQLFSFADWLDWLLMVFGGLASAIHGAAMPAFFIFFAHLVHSLGRYSTSSPSQRSHMVHEVAQDALYFVYLSIVRLVSGWLEVSLWLYTGDRQASKMRREYLRALISQDVGFFDTDSSTGEVVVGISSDTALIQEAIGSKTGSIIHYIAQFISGYIIGFITLWKLTLVTLAIMPLLIAAGGACAYTMVGLTRKSQESYVQAAEVAQEVIAQIRTVYAFGGEEKASKAYSKALLLTKKLGKRNGLVKGLSMGVLYGLGFCQFAFLLWYSGTLVRKHITNGGQAFSTIFNVIASSLALGQAAPDIVAIGKAKASGYTIMKMIKRKPVIGFNKEEGITLAKVDGHIELRAIHFSYPSRPDVSIFQEFSLTIPAGKVVAIVGSSGSGKSTVISLIERFYDPISGEVLLDGHDIKSLQLKWLRSQMGLVNQEPALFATNIRENILYGSDGNVSMEEVVKAASVSRAHDFIDALPKGYDTEVGERGVQLSGGQKQRIAIARAMVKNPTILLMDEATSALDAESENIVQEALDRIMVGRTTIVVAHRLSTIQNADVIAVVQNGRVLEVGTHRELMANPGAYASLIRLQKAGHTRQAQEGGTIPRLSRGSSLSLSQRTFSFRSTGDSVTSGLSMRLKGELDVLAGTRPSVRRVVGMASNDWPYGLLGSIGALVAGAQTPLFALIISQSLEYYYSPSPAYMKRGLNKVSALLGGAGVLALLSYVSEFYYSGIVGEGITVRIRAMMFSAILQNEIGWFDQNNSALLTSRLSADAPLVRAVVVDRFIALLQNVGLIITAFTVAFTLQWKVAGVMLATFPALLASYAGQERFMKGYYGDIGKAYARANMVAGEAVSNIRTVAAFCAEEKVMELFSKELVNTEKHSFIRAQIGGLGFGLSQFFVFSSYALTLWYASVLMEHENASFGNVMKCFIVLMITAFGVAQALSLAPDILRSMQTLEAVFHILDRGTQIDADDPKGEEVAQVKGAIELRSITFSYPARPDAQIFRDFDLKIRRGHSLALVGASGSGKSSIIALIARFYDPQGGKVMIDGKDIRLLKLKQLRQHMGLVQQEPALFSTNIYENICYGKDGATEAEVEAAAKAANAHSFISALPDGYRTEVGERGVQLSGGQKQRVAIARAVLRNPAILLLDEATSALDAESEKLVQDALDKLMQRRTTVVVAHRLTTIQNAHCIAVLQSGSIVEQGSHNELLEKQGAYFQLLNLSEEGGVLT